MKRTLTLAVAIVGLVTAGIFTSVAPASAEEAASHIICLTNQDSSGAGQKALCLVLPGGG